MKSIAGLFNSLSLKKDELHVYKGDRQRRERISTEDMIRIKMNDGRYLYFRKSLFRTSKMSYIYFIGNSPLIYEHIGSRRHSSFQEIFSIICEHAKEEISNAVLFNLDLF